MSQGEQMKIIDLIFVGFVSLLYVSSWIMGFISGGIIASIILSISFTPMTILICRKIYKDYKEKKKI